MDVIQRTYLHNQWPTPNLQAVYIYLALHSELILAMCLVVDCSCMIPVALVSYIRRYMDGERLGRSHIPIVVALMVWYCGGLEKILESVWTKWAELDFMQ